jgi:hypothetical protein
MIFIVIFVFNDLFIYAINRFEMTNVDSNNVSGSHGQDERDVDYAIDQQCISELLGIPNCMFRVNDILANVS